MKKLLIVTFVFGAFTTSLVSCGNGNASENPSASDSINKPAPDNSNATNPSVSDTAYPKRDSLSRDTTNRR